MTLTARVAKSVADGRVVEHRHALRIGQRIGQRADIRTGRMVLRIVAGRIVEDPLADAAVAATLGSERVLDTAIPASAMGATRLAARRRRRARQPDAADESHCIRCTIASSSPIWLATACLPARAHPSNDVIPLTAPTNATPARSAACASTAWSPT